MTSTDRLSGATDGKWKTLKYDWTITNYASFEPNASEAVIYSDPFETDHNVSWQATFTQRGLSQFAQFGLRFLGCSVFGAFYSTVVELKCNPLLRFKPLFEPKRLVFDSNSCEHLVSTNMTLGDAFKLIREPSKKLTITYCITTRQVDSFIIPRNNLHFDLENSVLTNVTLVVYTRINAKIFGQSVYAHKEILAAHSTVFAAMFNTDMVENQQNQVQINDVTYEVLNQLVTFIYTGKAQIAPDMAVGLLAAADKYALDRLKAACEHALFKYNNLSKTIETLVLADKYNAQQLKAHILRSIKANVDDVIKTAGWKSLFVQHPELLIEVHRAIASK